ncbi:MAG: ATP-binding cassette domain-containing protein [Myxococcales bacterium]|nr:ATP-binding cassette domain-containing protein [Myxococcales bacterium]
MSELLLRLDDLCIRDPQRALVDGVSLQVEAGRITALVGASGSGKSLSARAVMGVVDVVPGLTRGRLSYPALHPDEDLFAGVAGGGRRSHRALARRMQSLRGGYVTYAPQGAATALNPGRTLGWQLGVALSRRREVPTRIPAEIRRVLDEVGLPLSAAAALPAELSGGMAQRAALAVAIAPAPRVLIADEPETGLDPVLRRTVLELLLEVASQHGVGLLLITHSAETIRRVADHVVRIGTQGAA